MRSVTSRRLFFSKAGAAIAAPLALAGATGVAAAAEDADVVRARLALLEDLDAIRALNRAYLRYLNDGEHDRAAGLFANPAEAVVDRRLAGVSVDDDAAHGGIALAEDRQTASARLVCTALIATPLEPCPLVDMARAQGGGVARRSEAGVFENAYVKRSGVWRLLRSSYRPT